MISLMVVPSRYTNLPWPGQCFLVLFFQLERNPRPGKLRSSGVRLFPKDASITLQLERQEEIVEPIPARPFRGAGSITAG